MVNDRVRFRLNVNQSVLPRISCCHIVDGQKFILDVLATVRGYCWNKVGHVTILVRFSPLIYLSQKQAEKVCRE
jgi:hypothetical protein